MLILFASHDSRGQTNAAGNAGVPQQDRVLQELLVEVRQLRIALQQISTNAYRGQVLVERLRLQQEQVDRLTQELSSISNQISENRSSQATAKVKVEEAEKGQDTGVVSPSVTVRYREALEGLRRQEQTLTEREVQVTAQLQTERENLSDLHKRLDALELEMVTSQPDDKPKR
jgi:hypothetical protein